MHTLLDTAPLRSESPPQKRSGMARVLKGLHSFTCTPRRSSAVGKEVDEGSFILRVGSDGFVSRSNNLS